MMQLYMDAVVTHVEKSIVCIKLSLLYKWGILGFKAELWKYNIIGLYKEMVFRVCIENLQIIIPLLFEYNESVR